MRKYRVHLAVLLATLLVAAGLRAVAPQVLPRISLGTQGFLRVAMPLLYGPALRPPVPEPASVSLIRTASASQLYRALFPVTQWNWPEAQMVTEARARFAKSYPVETRSHYETENEKEILARMGILKALGSRAPGPAAIAFYRQVLRSPEEMLVRRQALENLRPVLAQISEKSRSQILANLPPLVVSLAAVSGHELLNEIWQKRAHRSLSAAEDIPSLDEWENLPCPSPEHFEEMAEAVHWDGDLETPYTCNLTPMGKFGRVLEFLSTIQLPFDDNTGELGQNLRRPFEYLRARSTKLTFDFTQVHTVAFNYIFKQEIHLGAAFFSGSPLESISVLIHEARHSDIVVDPGHVICMQGDLPRMPGACDDELSNDKRAGAYSYGVFFSMALARSKYVSASDREILEAQALSLVSRRFNRLLPRLAQFQDLIAGLDNNGQVVVLHPFANRAITPFGLNEKLRFERLSQDDTSGGLSLYPAIGPALSWNYAREATSIALRLDLPESTQVDLMRRIRIPGGEYPYWTILGGQAMHYLGTDAATAALVLTPFPVVPDFAVKDFFFGDLVFTYFLSKDGNLELMRSEGSGRDFKPMHETAPKFRQATGGILKDTVFAVGEDGLLYRHTLRDYPAIAGRTVLEPISTLVLADFQSPVPAVQYEEGTALKALLDTEGGLWVGYHGDPAPVSHISQVKLKAFAFLKVLSTSGVLGKIDPSTKYFQYQCSVNEDTIDPWFGRGVGLVNGKLFFQGDNGECLTATLPEGVQGRISAFSFVPGAFSGKYGSRSFQFAPVNLELKLMDGTVRTIRPYEGWN